jgi:serine/threonine protein phosphatase 1
MGITIDVSPAGEGRLLPGGPEMNEGHLSEIADTLAAFGSLLPAGQHRLGDWAAIIDAQRPDSIVASAFAERLKEIERHYQVPLPGSDLVVMHGPNTVGRDWVAGDIHGQYDKLMNALSEAGFNFHHDRLFQVGDLVDRGADSLRCLNLVFEPWFYGCLGNHERLALNALREGPTSDEWDLWFVNGGQWIYDEDQGEAKAVIEDALHYLPLAREVTVNGRQVGIVHAEPPRNWHVMKHTPATYLERMTWGRTRIKYGDTSLVDDIDLVVVGHSIVDAPRWLGNVCYIDTGAFLAGGSVTVLPLDTLSPPCPGGAPLSDPRTLYRLLHAEGPFTLLAPDLEIAAAAAILLGRGQYALQEIGGSRQMPQFVTDGADAWFSTHLGQDVAATLDRVFHERVPALVTCLSSVVAGSPDDRYYYDEQLQSLPDGQAREAFREQWRESHRQAARDLSERAWMIAARIQRGMAPSASEVPDA